MSLVQAHQNEGNLDGERVRLTWGVTITLRDGVKLHATLYAPALDPGPLPCIVTMTPYIAQSFHAQAIYFAGNGFRFLVADVRGRGNSEGTFQPLIQEADDGHDIVEWIAGRDWCDGRIAMWGGSYSGFNQWATASRRPPHLATIVPAAAACVGVDFPFRNAIAAPYLLQWLLLTAGVTGQDQVFADTAFWSKLWRRRFESGAPFCNLGTEIGLDAKALKDWIAHPGESGFYDAFRPSVSDYAAIAIPVLSITGIYDDDQPGALAHYKEHVQRSEAEHFLIIGPWDHAGTRVPRRAVGGVEFGEASLLDLQQLHLEWYRWTMSEGPRPTFLKKRVAYYVTGAEQWRYADSLASITLAHQELFLGSSNSASSVFGSGILSPAKPEGAGGDQYVYNPLDVSTAEAESAIEFESLVDQTLLLARDGGQLVYYTQPFAKPVELSGFFRLLAWIAIDQPDTDFQVIVSEVLSDGQCVRLTSDLKRARYRADPRVAELVTTESPLLYDFNTFTFTSRLIAKGSRLRLVIGAPNSIYLQKNFNSGGVVAEETFADARTVTVRLSHCRDGPSALYLPYATAEDIS